MRIGAAKNSYAADQALFDTHTQRAWLAILVAGLIAFPFIAGDYWLYLACLAAIQIISTTGLNILTGYTGLVSLGQAAFMGIGAYTAAILQQHGVPSLVNLVAGGLVAMLAGLVVGLPSLRVKGLYLAIATIAASFFTHFIFANWTQVTGGTGGLKVPPAHVFGLVLDSSFRLYWLIVPLAAAFLYFAANLFRTRVGRAFIAIRDRDISAGVLGISLLHYKLLSFAVSSFYAGVAGGLWAYFFRVITPESFPLQMSIFFLAAVIVGGLGTIAGSVFGALFMTLVPEVLKLIVGWLPLTNAVALLSPVRTIVFGTLIVGFLIFEPHGLAEMWRRSRRFFHLWPFRT